MEDQEWAEELERQARLLKAAQDLGVVVDTTEGEPPPLNEDGSLADADTEMPTSEG